MTWFLGQKKNGVARSILPIGRLPQLYSTVCPRRLELSSVQTCCKQLSETQQRVEYHAGVERGAVVQAHRHRVNDVKKSADRC